MPVPRDALSLPALQLAPRLLGAVLVSTVDDKEVRLQLTEVEAYEGTDDPASHAFRGPTKRSSIMFGPPGFLYTYFVYGMHWAANIVCDVDGRASAVLLRAGDVVEGAEYAKVRRPAARNHADLARGPARLASCLGLTGVQNGADLCSSSSPIYIERLGDCSEPIAVGPRVGIAVAAERPWRFWIDGHRTVSTYRPGGRPRRRANRHTEPP